MTSSNSSKNPTVGVFVKVPEPGRVKTRLGEDIGMDRAASFYAGCTAWLLKRLEQSEFQTTVFFTPATERDKFRGMYEGLDSLTLEKQKGADLGERMFHALQYLSGQGSLPLIIGSDTPLLPLEYLQDAVSLLKENDLVLGPAHDGGYYLVGMQNPTKAIFFNMEWSHSDVLQETLDRAKNQSLRTEVLPEWNDIDTLADLNNRFG
ncbi:MAG: TIGR04282 family arsenosugar biosynthesis glycosyltransferase [bacterium]